MCKVSVDGKKPDHISKLKYVLVNRASMKSNVAGKHLPSVIKMTANAKGLRLEYEKVLFEGL